MRNYDEICEGKIEILNRECLQLKFGHQFESLHPSVFTAAVDL